MKIIYTNVNNELSHFEIDADYLQLIRENPERLPTLRDAKTKAKTAIKENPGITSLTIFFLSAEGHLKLGEFWDGDWKLIRDFGQV